MRYIFRNDDVSANTRIWEMSEIYKFLTESFDCDIWSAVTVFSKGINCFGPLYPDMPLSTKDINYLFEVDRPFWRASISNEEVVSHGLFHVDHSKLSVDAQKMSIIGSCSLLKAKRFVPPFGLFDENTARICADRGVELVENSGWRSLESEPFDPSHQRWFFHSWNFTPEEFKRLFKEKHAQV